MRYYFLIRYDALVRRRNLSMQSGAIRKRVGFTHPAIAMSQTYSSRFLHSKPLLKQGWLYIDAIILLIQPLPSSKELMITSSCTDLKNPGEHVTV